MICPSRNSQAGLVSGRARNDSKLAGFVVVLTIILPLRFLAFTILLL
jgi:hypothetical protein